MRSSHTDQLATYSRSACTCRVSRGVPRIINILADTALVYGFADALPIIGHSVIYAVVKDKAKHGSLQLSHLIKRKQRQAGGATVDPDADTGPTTEDVTAAALGTPEESGSAPKATRPTASVVDFDKDTLFSTLLKREG